MLDVAVDHTEPESKRSVSRDYRRVWWWSVGMQAFVGFYGCLQLDLGNLFELWLKTLIVFWLSSWLIMWRRPKAPRIVDLRFVQFGYAPILLALVWVAHDYSKGPAWVWGVTWLVAMGALCLAGKSTTANTCLNP